MNLGWIIGLSREKGCSLHLSPATRRVRKEGWSQSAVKKFSKKEHVLNVPTPILLYGNQWGRVPYASGKKGEFLHHSELNLVPKDILIRCSIALILIQSDRAGAGVEPVFAPELTKTSSLGLSVLSGSGNACFFSRGSCVLTLLRHALIRLYRSISFAFWSDSTGTPVITLRMWFCSIIIVMACVWIGIDFISNWAMQSLKRELWENTRTKIKGIIET